MAIISFITTQLVQAYPHYTNTHTLPQHPLYNWSTAPSLHPVFLHFFLFLQKEKSPLWGVQWQKAKDTPQYSKREQGRQRKRRRELGLWGQREREVDPDSVYPFFLHWFETDLHCAALQATGSEISPSAQSPDDLIQTGYPSVTVTGLPQQQDVLIILSAQASQEPKQELRNKNCMFLKCIK